MDHGVYASYKVRYLNATRTAAEVDGSGLAY